VLIIERATGLVTVQDLGRRGHMHEAVPPGGALVPELLIAANRAARNEDGAPAFEVMGVLVVRAEIDLSLATDRDGARVVRAGQTWTVASGQARVVYLAVRGGVDVPMVLNGRGTLLVARLGRALRGGDRLCAAAAPPARSGEERPAVGDGPIRVLAGPDPEAFARDALEALTTGQYTIATTSDRVGTRLIGPPIARAPGFRERSRPMVCGAIEVPGDGGPIVLGPEHPTTGGYPILGVVASEDLGRLFAIRLGGGVRFVRH
jgi:allophanate hydrolase subunit 2